MTREEAIKLQVGKSKIFVIETGLEEIFEMSVTGINVENYLIPNSPAKVTAFCQDLKSRVYMPQEIHNTEIEALRKLADTYTFKSDQNLRKRHAVCEKIAKLKGGRDET